MSVSQAKLIEIEQQLTIKDSMAPIQTKLILQLLLPFRAVGVLIMSLAQLLYSHVFCCAHSRVRNPPIRLHQGSRTQILVLVPPIRWARSRATGTQDTFVHPVEFLAVTRRLQELTLFRWVIVLQVRLDRLVLFVKECEIRDEVFHNVHYGGDEGKN